MNDLTLLLTVAPRGATAAFLEFFKAQGAATVLTLLAHGTAASEVLDLLDLEATDKSLFLSLTSSAASGKLLRALGRTMYLDAPGNGIALALPLSGISGSAMRYLAGHQLQLTPTPSTEVLTMQDHPYRLIIAIANQGYAEPVMDAARQAGATGGTILHAKSSGLEPAEKFFGVSLAAEKELILIACPRDAAAPIMKAISVDAGMTTKAQAMTLALPVGAVAGLRLEPEDAE